MIDEEIVLGVAVRIEDAATKECRILKAEFPATHLGIINSIPKEELIGKMITTGFYSFKKEFTSLSK